MLGKIVAWLSINWETVALVAYVLINLLNAASRHWSEHKGVVRWCLWLAEMLSILRSAGTPAGAVLGNTKLPGVSVKNGSVVKLLPFAVIVLASVSACGTTTRGYLAKGLDIAAAVDKVAIPAIEKLCVEKVRACGKVEPEKCVQFQKCHAALIGYQGAMNSVTKGLAEANRALEILGVP